MIKAPFTPNQVEALNRFQQRRDIHPFTCPGIDDVPECHVENRTLIATPDGWICSCGKYHQDWAHAFMIEDS
jgi:hypothetical protein